MFVFIAFSTFFAGFIIIHSPSFDTFIDAGSVIAFGEFISHYCQREEEIHKQTEVNMLIVTSLFKLLFCLHLFLNYH